MGMLRTPKILPVGGQATDAQIARAETLLIELDRKRVASGYIMATSVEYVHGAFAKLTCNDYYLKAIILIRDLAAQILLFNEEEFHSYNYYSDTVKKVLTYQGSGLLSPIYNGRSQLEENHYATYSGGWSQGAASGNDYTFLGGLNSYEMGVFSDDSEIYGRIGGAIGNIATVPDTFLQDFAKPYGSLFGLPAYKTTYSWNLYRGVILYSLNVANKTVNDSWYWVPSFFLVEPNDSLNLKPGWYYGVYPFPDYDQDNTIESMSVSFKGLVDSRASGSDFDYGWCEVVTEVDGVQKCDINFYFQDSLLPAPSNQYFYRELVLASYVSSLITIGSVLHGFTRTFQLRNPFGDLSVPDVSMWSFYTYDGSGAGIAIVSGASARFYKYTGAAFTIYETDQYHSHSISHNGTTIAIFESSDGSLINRTIVFDLHGQRLLEEGSEYTSGGITEIIDSAVVSSVEALTACLIPFREDNFSPNTVNYTLENTSPLGVEQSDYTDYLPSLSSMVFTKDATGITIYKVTCENGVDAKFGVSPDECFESEVVVDDPDTETRIDKLVSKWDVGGVWKGVVRGNYAGAHPDMRFSGLGTGSSGWYGNITAPSEFSIYEQDGTDIIGASGYNGELIPGRCLEDDMTISPSCNVEVCESGGLTLSASSSCGQTAELNIEQITDGGNPLTVSIVGDEINVGDFIGASGGISPYTFSISIGSVDSDTGEVLSLPECESGDASTLSVGVEDYCGASDSEEVLRSGGYWVFDPYEDYYSEHYCGGAEFSVYTIIGKYKYREQLNCPYFKINYEYQDTWNSSLEDCSNSQRWPTTRTAPLPDWNSWGLAWVNPTSGGDGHCYSYDFPADYVHFRCFRRTRARWQC